MNVTEGTTVDIAQDGIDRRLGFEHERGRIYESDVNIQPNLHHRFQLQTGRRRRRAHSLLDAMTGGGPGRGPVVEVVSYRQCDNHERATYHHIYFENGAQGIYPESCLVPTPEEVLRNG